MDLLTLAAENHGLKSEVDLLQQQISTLQNQVADKILRNEELSRENEILRQENGKLKKRREPVFSKGLFSVRYVQQSKIKNNFKYYTGFVYTQFLCILNFLMPKRGLNELPFKLKKTISKALKMKAEDQLLLVLMKLRLNLQFHFLGNLFNLSPQDTGAIFREWIKYMYYRFGSVPLWPSRSSIIDMMSLT
jgi:regulator of replication initiation timing